MSATPQLPFGRRWEIKILGSQDELGNRDDIIASASSFEPEALRATFDVCQFGYAAWWYGEIVIYNLDGRSRSSSQNALQNTTQKVLTEGTRVVVSAGYQQGDHYGVVFDGKIFQAFVERENVNDYKTILHCVAGKDVVVNNIMAFTLDGNPSQADVAIQAATQAPTKLSLQLMEKMGQTTLPRGKTVFSNPSTYFDQLANDNKAVWFYDGTKAFMSDFTIPEPDAYVYTPNTGLIGTPIQTQDGVQFRVLLDPRLRVKLNPVQVKLDMTSMIFLKAQIDQLPSPLDMNGVYVVGAVRHFGDTRGDAWYTDVTGYTTVGGRLGMLGATASSSQAEAQQAAAWAAKQNVNQK